MSTVQRLSHSCTSEKSIEYDQICPQIWCGSNRFLVTYCVKTIILIGNVYC